MAIKSDKLLDRPSGKSAMIGGSSVNIVLTKKSIKNIGIMRTKVTQIEGILKGTLALEKKDLDNKKRLDSRRRRESQEDKLETKPNAEKGQMKMPSAPRLGILDWIKNFIGKIILGYFAVRLIEHLPKIMPIVKFLGSAADFIINVGGDLLDKLITFVDWGYKAYDATRGFVKNLFGNDGVKQFDQLSGLLNKFLNLAIIAGMIAAGSGGVRGGPGPGARVLGRGVSRSLTRLGLKTIGKSGTKEVLKVVRPLVRNAPLIGGLLEFGISWALGDPLPKAAFRGVGTFLLGAVGTAIGGPIGLAIGGYAGGEIGGVLYDMFFGNKNPQPITEQTQANAGGGATRGGQSQGGVTRTIGGTTKKGKYKKTLAQKPGKVEITSPGADIGGEDKLFGIFPNPFKAAQRLINAMNPFDTIKKTGEELGKTDYFGPILAITSKVIAGQKPTKTDYKNVGLGINLLIAKGIQDQQLKGGIVARFAEGGMVDPDILAAAETGGDISDWVAKTFNTLIESKVERNLRMIRENAEKEKQDPGADPNASVTPRDDVGDIEYGPLPLNMTKKQAFATIYEFAKKNKAAMPELVAGMSMHESGYLTSPLAREFNNPFGQTGSGTKGSVKIVGRDGKTRTFAVYNNLEDAIKFHVNNWNNDSKHGKGLGTYSSAIEGLKIGLPTYAPTSDGNNHTNYIKSVSAILSTMGFDPRKKNPLADLSTTVLVQQRRPTAPGTSPGASPAMAGSVQKGSVVQWLHGTPGRAGYEPYGHGGQKNAHDHFGFKSRSAALAAFTALEKSGYKPWQFEGFTRQGVRDAGGPGAHSPSGGHYGPVGGKPTYNDMSDGAAFDIPWATYGSGPIGPRDYAKSLGAAKIVGAAFNGMNKVISSDGFLKVHKGEFVSVTDADSFRLVGGILADINSIENQTQLVARAPSIIERLKAISGYTDYEQQGGTQIIEVPVEVPVPMGGEGGGSFAIALGGGEGGYDHASGLYER